MLRPVAPGTGKTTFLSTQVRKDAIEYGIDEVMVTSFTRAAAAEIAGRDLPIPESHVGTLHAMCYRALGRQTIAETKIKEWNEVAASYSKLTHAGADVDEPYWDQDAAGPGDAMLSESQRLRALMVPIERWPQSVQSFYAAWKQWKDDNEYIDFTDMIERGYNELARAPDAPSVILADECFSGDAKVTLDDGSQMSIQEMVDNRYAGKVLSYDEQHDVLVSRRVIGWHKLPRKGLLRHFGRSWATEDHPVYTREHGYISLGLVHDHTILEVNHEDLRHERSINREGKIDCSRVAHWRCLLPEEPRTERERESLFSSRISSTRVFDLETSRVESLVHNGRARADINPIQERRVRVCNQESPRVYEIMGVDSPGESTRKNDHYSNNGSIQRSLSSRFIYGQWISKSFERSIAHRGGFRGICTDSFGLAERLRHSKSDLEQQGILHTVSHKICSDFDRQNNTTYSSCSPIQTFATTSAEYCADRGRIGFDERCVDGNMCDLWRCFPSEEVCDDVREVRVQQKANGEAISGVAESVYCIDVEEHHNFFAEGILVHNCQDFSRLQLTLIRKWGERAKKFIIVGDDDQCQPWDALVLTTKGEKYISELRVKKDVLLSWDFAPDNWEKMVTQAKFKIGRRMYRGEMYTFVVNQRRIRCTPEHRLLVRDKRNGILYQEAALIEPDWNQYEMLCVGRGWKPIIECYKQDEWAGYVYSLDVDRYHTYVTDGVVSHNCLYTWSGSTPDAFLDPPLPTEQKRVLSKSYRVPAKVHEFSQKWVQKLSRREPKEYKPRDAEGAVGRRPDITWMNTRMMLPLIEKAENEGKTFMILASCGYMLTPTIAMLRENGLTFHNPWRRTRGDWNPLSAGRGVSMAQRLLAYMRPDVKTWGAEARMWTADDLLEWIPILGVKDTMVRGAKKEIEAIPEIERRDELSVNDLLAWFEEDAVSHMLDCDLKWFHAHVMDSKRHGIEYPMEILQRRGADALKKTPNIIIGTVHSVKGGEASEVLLFPDLSAAGAKEWARSKEGRDAVIRQMYVGITRAKETLILGGQATGMAVQL